jgi:hypothetical protein
VPRKQEQKRKDGGNRVMQGVADIVVSDATGEWEMGKYTGRRTSPTHDEIAQLAYSLYE